MCRSLIDHHRGVKTCERRSRDSYRRDSPRDRRAMPTLEAKNGLEKDVARDRLNITDRYEGIVQEKVKILDVSLLELIFFRKLRADVKTRLNRS